jgi:hypothetical protein
VIIAASTSTVTPAIDLAARAGDDYSVAWHSATLAMFFASYGDTDSALRLAQQAHAIGEQLKNPTLLGISDISVGYAISVTDPDAAMPNLKKGRLVLRALGNQTLRYTGERTLARLVAARGEWPRAAEIYITTKSPHAAAD